MPFRRACHGLLLKGCPPQYLQASVHIYALIIGKFSYFLNAMFCFCVNCDIVEVTYHVCVGRGYYIYRLVVPANCIFVHIFIEQHVAVI